MLHMVDDGFYRQRDGFGSYEQRRYFKGGGKVPAPPPPPPPPPKEEDPAVQEAAAEAARRRKQGRGFRSTVLGALVQRGQQAGAASPAAAGGTPVGTGTTFGG